MDKKSKKKYLLNILLIIVIGGLSIYFSIGSQLESTIHYIHNAKISWLIVAGIVMALYFFVNGLNLTLFARVYKPDYTIKQGIVNSLAGIFFNGITPMSSGGQFYQVYAFNKQGIQATYSSSILLMLFIVYQSVLVTLTSIVMIFRYTFFSSLYSGFFSLAIVGFLLNLAVISSLFLGANSKHLQNFLCNNIIKLLAKIHIIRNYEDTRFKVETKLHNFRKELKQLQKNKQILIKSIALNLLKLILLYSMPFFCAKAMGTPIQWNLFFDFIGITAFVYMISDFVPLPGASGGSEGTFYLLLRVFLKNGTSATLLIWRFATYYLGLIIGCLVMSFSKELSASKTSVQVDGQDIIVEEIDEVTYHDIKK